MTAPAETKPIALGGSLDSDERLTTSMAAWCGAIRPYWECRPY